MNVPALPTDQSRQQIVLWLNSIRGDAALEGRRITVGGVDVTNAVLIREGSIIVYVAPASHRPGQRWSRQFLKASDGSFRYHEIANAILLYADGLAQARADKEKYARVDTIAQALRAEFGLSDTSDIRLVAATDPARPVRLSLGSRPLTEAQARRMIHAINAVLADIDAEDGRKDDHQ